MLVDTIFEFLGWSISVKVDAYLRSPYEIVKEAMEESPRPEPAEDPISETTTTRKTPRKRILKMTPELREHKRRAGRKGAASRWKKKEA